MSGTAGPGRISTPRSPDATAPGPSPSCRSGPTSGPLPWTTAGRKPPDDDPRPPPARNGRTSPDRQPTTPISRSTFRDAALGSWVPGSCGGPPPEGGVVAGPRGGDDVPNRVAVYSDNYPRTVSSGSLSYSPINPRAAALESPSTPEDDLRDWIVIRSELHLSPE